MDKHYHGEDQYPPQDQGEGAIPHPVEAEGEGKEKIRGLKIAPIFNPFQRAPANWKDKTLDKLKKSPLITMFGGYHHILSHTKNPPVGYFATNARLILFPHQAVDDEQHFGLGTYVTNPLAPLAALMMYAMHNLDDNNALGIIALAIPTVPLVFLALLLDALKMVVTYIALAIPAAVALPIMNAMDKHKEGKGAAEFDDYHYAGGQEQGQGIQL